MIKVLLLVAFLICLGESTCPQGAIEGLNPSDCYIYVGDPKSWVAAESDCVVRKGHLTSISDAFHNTFLVQEIASISMSNNGSWIGANTQLNPGA